MFQAALHTRLRCPAARLLVTGTEAMSDKLGCVSVNFFVNLDKLL